MKYIVKNVYKDGQETVNECADLDEAKRIVDEMYAIDDTNFHSSVIEEYSVTEVEYNSSWKRKDFRELMEFEKESLALKLVEYKERNVHLKQLKSLLYGMGVHCDDLLLTKDPHVFQSIGANFLRFVGHEKSKQR